jgi:hypothetical protein
LSLFPPFLVTAYTVIDVVVDYKFLLHEAIMPGEDAVDWVSAMAFSFERP